MDEAQDTQKDLMETLMEVQSKYASFCLGLIGDTMQRIFLDGKKDLGVSLPEDWEKPFKQMNHRSNTRIVKLANDIRKDIDTQKQKARTDKQSGIVRLFICSLRDSRKKKEQYIRTKMKEISSDENWNVENSKTLILEHSMAAQRLGYENLYNALKKLYYVKDHLNKEPEKNR